jgi:predicted transcriptional regulator
METQKIAKSDTYHEWFDKEVKLGLDDLEAGRVVPDAVVRENILKSRLNRLRDRKKAA